LQIDRRIVLRALLGKIKEAAFSVIPVVVIVLIMYLTPWVSFTGTEIGVFLVSALLLVIGIGLFTLGADVAMSPMGEQVGTGLSRSGKPLLLLAVCFAMGVVITVAEPDLSVLAGQVSQMVNGWVLIGVVGAGVGVFLVLSVIKVIKNKPLAQILMYFYLVLFALASVMIARGGNNFTALAFDSGGVTTGPITVPFIMALGIGIASTFSTKNDGENSFGSIALCSVGPVLAVMMIGIFSKGSVTYELPDYSMASHLGRNVWVTLLDTVSEVAIALGIISAFFFVLQVTVLKLPVRKLLGIAHGILYTFTGLVIFMTAVKIGFMPIGYKLGTELASAGRTDVLVIFGFITGMATVAAEPAVHVLNSKVEEVTNGMISKRSMMIALSAGVGISIALSVVRIIFDFSVLYYLIPGYIISLGLSLLVPGIYTSIAFDSGGVASGPLTSSFVLPFAIGACYVLQGAEKIPLDAFGVVAMVAMTPLITIQVLGFRATVAERLRKKRAIAKILSADDAQIIEFM
jgi:hypothetical protein